MRIIKNKPTATTLYIIIVTAVILIMHFSFLPEASPSMHTYNNEYQTELLARAVDYLCYDKPLAFQVMTARSILYSMHKSGLTLSECIWRLEGIKPSDLARPASKRARMSVMALYNIK